MRLMSDAYQQLLEAAIMQLEQLKARGVRFIQVSPERLAQLNTARMVLSTKRAPSLVARLSQRVQTPPAEKPLSASNSKAGSVPKVQTVPLFSAPPVEARLPEITPEAKTAAFAELRQRAMACVKCPHLASSRKNVVFGVGSIGAQLMFVGEAPGADEDEQAEPFVGKAGQLLTRIIQTMGLTRNTVYIANILKCRPDTPGQNSGNRKPTAEEMQTCIPYLHEQIDLIQPKVIVALGGTAVEGLLGKGTGIMRLRGHWQSYRRTPLMPTYHPAYLLRNQALTEKRRVCEDMLQEMQKLQLPISERQRNYFSSPGA